MAPLNLVASLKYIHIEKVPRSKNNEKSGTEEFQLLHDYGGCAPPLHVSCKNFKDCAIIVDNFVMAAVYMACYWQFWT